MATLICIVLCPGWKVVTAILSGNVHLAAIFHRQSQA